MRIELLEKLVFALAVLAIVLVAALVGVFSFVIQQSSGISKEEELAAIEVDEWLNNSRRIASGQGAQIANTPLFVAPSNPGNGASTTTPGGKPGTPASAPAAPGQTDNYVVREGETI
ncbi:MAG: hypothetical protein ACAI25_12965, partial [Planctomycetota bacterium]